MARSFELCGSGAAACSGIGLGFCTSLQTTSGEAETSAGICSSLEESWLNEKAEITSIAAAKNMALNTTSSNEQTSGGEFLLQQTSFHSLLAMESSTFRS